MVEAGHVSSEREAFERYLGAGQPAAAERPSPSPERAIGAIREAGGVAGLAWRADDRCHRGEQHEQLQRVAAGQPVERHGTGQLRPDHCGETCGIEVLQESDAVVVLAVAGELEEVEGVVDGCGPRQVADERDARLQRTDEERLAPGVVACELRADLPDAALDLLGVEEDLADALVP